MLILILLCLLALVAIPFTRPSWRMVLVLVTLALIILFALGVQLPLGHGASLRIY